MRVDVHSHFLPREFRGLLRDWAKPVRIEDRDGRPTVVHGYGTLPLFPGFVDMEARSEWMADFDVDHTIVSASTPNVNEGPFSVEETVELCRALNDGYARLQDEYPDRVSGLAMLPLRDPTAAVEEVDRVRDLGLKGIALPTGIRDRSLAHPDLAPVFERIDALDLPVFMHPRRDALSDQLGEDEWMINPLAVFPSETTVQIARLLFAGFFDDHDFPVVIAHLGGTLPYLAGRLEHGRTAWVEPGEHPERPIAEYLREFYYDVISFHPPAVRMAVETVGADRLVFGTDYPFGVANPRATIGSVESAIPADRRDDVYGGTARDLFSL